MKKAPLLVLLILVGLAACAGLGLQFWVKPAVEQEIATILNNYFEKQGAKPKGPVKVTLNPLARVLTIAPLDLKLNPAMQLRDGQVALTTLKLTLKGMLALSPLSNLVSGSEEKVILLEQVSCPSVNVNFIEGNYKAKGLIAYNLAAQGSDLQDLQKNPQNFDKKRIFYVQKVHLAETKVQVPSGNKTLNLEFGAMDFSEITPKLLGKVEVAGLNIREGEHEVFRARQISYENLRLYSEEEWLNMAQSLLQASDEVKLERLANLFLGDEPLLEKVNLNDLTVDVEGSPLAIGRVSFEAKPQATLNRLEVHGLALASSLFEKAFKQKLPLPKLLHLGFGLGLSKLANEERTFSFNLGIDELASLELSLDSALKTYSKLFENFLTTPIANFHLKLTDQSLLARSAIYLEQAGLGGQEQIFTLLNGFKAKEQNPKIKATLDQIISFAERPGFITISSKAKQKFTLAKIDNMDPLEVIDFFDLKVNQGPKDLKTAVTEIKKQL